jgi:pimeloyl-ACP methyl ester carboxylesterase
MENPKKFTRREFLKRAGTAAAVGGALAYESQKRKTEAVSDDPFEKQFAKREMINVNGGIAEVVDLQADNTKEEVPTLFAPAWAVTLPVYKPALRTLLERGRRTISLNYPRAGGDIILNDDQNDLVKEFPTEEVRKALTLIGILDHKHIERTDVIAHSEGAANAAIAALLHPEKFRNMVLVGPPGLIGEDTPMRLVKGFASQSNPKPSLKEIPVHEESKKYADEHGQVAIEYPEILLSEEGKEVGKIAETEALKYMLANPRRALQESWGMSQIQMHDLISKLHEKGIGIVIMSGVDDPVFQTKKMAALIKQGTVDGFLSVRGGHGQIGENPERFMVAAEQMLTALQKKQSKKS